MSVLSKGLSPLWQQRHACAEPAHAQSLSKQSPRHSISFRRHTYVSPRAPCPYDKPSLTPRVPLASRFSVGVCRLTVVDCGIFGIYKHSGSAAVEIYEGLLMLQHRGQDSAGIVCYDGHRFRERKVRRLIRIHSSRLCVGFQRSPSVGNRRTTGS